MSENNLTSLCITAVLFAAIAAVGFGVTLGANSMRNCAATCGPTPWLVLPARTSPATRPRSASVPDGRWRRERQNTRPSPLGDDNDSLMTVRRVGDVIEITIADVDKRASHTSADRRRRLTPRAVAGEGDRNHDAARPDAVRGHDAECRCTPSQAQLQPGRLLSWVSGAFRVRGCAPARLPK